MVISFFVKLKLNRAFCSVLFWSDMMSILDVVQSQSFPHFFYKLWTKIIELTALCNFNKTNGSLVKHWQWDWTKTWFSVNVKFDFYITLNSSRLLSSLKFILNKWRHLIKWMSCQNRFNVMKQLYNLYDIFYAAY